VIDPERQAAHARGESVNPGPIRIKHNNDGTFSMHLPELGVFYEKCKWEMPTDLPKGAERVEIPFANTQPMIHGGKLYSRIIPEGYLSRFPVPRMSAIERDMLFFGNTFTTSPNPEVITSYSHHEFKNALKRHFPPDVMSGRQVGKSISSHNEFMDEMARDGHLPRWMAESMMLNRDGTPANQKESTDV
jgi:hypothetical protein